MNKNHANLLFLVFILLSFSFTSIGRKPDCPLTISEKALFAEKDSICWESYDLKIKPPEISYSESREWIEDQKFKLQAKMPLDSCEMLIASQIFEDALVNRLLPYWYGTEWDFNGYSSKPRKGKIACGYLVSTTLLHIGLNINRYKLAQQGPENEAKTLALDAPVVHVEEETEDAALKTLNDLTKSGLYFIGLGSSHVGMLLKRKGQLFFIHSNYMGEAVVLIEKAEASEVMSQFMEFYLVPISTSPALIQAWLSGSRITISTN